MRFVHGESKQEIGRVFFQARKRLMHTTYILIPFISPSLLYNNNPSPDKSVKE
jgi:hypothetical protein